MTYTVIKNNHLGEEVLRYSGEIIQQGDHHICIRAQFAQATRDLGYMLLKQGDYFTEWFYDDRWYNVFKVEDIDSGDLKGYYCNLTRPATISDTHVAADDLALDVFIKPNGHTLLLDQDEYDDLPLNTQEREQVQQAIEMIHQLVTNRAEPFDALNT